MALIGEFMMFDLIAPVEGVRSADSALLGHFVPAM